MGYQDTDNKSQDLTVLNSSLTTGGRRQTDLPPTQEIIKDVFGEEAELAIAIAKAESNLNPLATNINSNGSRDCGIFQINSVHNPTKEQCEDAEENIKLAYSIYSKSGWRAWAAYNNGRYNKFLN